MTTVVRNEVDHRYSAPGATAPEWESIVETLAHTEIYALTTVLPDGSPHTVPVAGVWTDSGFWFCTGAYEQKARNIAENSRASVHVGGQDFGSGMNIVVRGEVIPTTGEPWLTMLADAINAKYPEPFRFSPKDGALVGAHGNLAPVYFIRPEVAHVFTRGENNAQVRYTFEPAQD